MRSLLIAGVVSITTVVSAGLGACGRPTTEQDLARFTGGFDPTRHDAGVLPEVDKAALGRPLRFHVPPFYSDGIAAGAAGELERYLEEETRLDVDILAQKGLTYTEMADVLARGEVDVAELTPYQYAVVLQRGTAVEPLAASVAHGASTYGSYLVVRQGSPVKTLEDLRGKKLGFVDPLSTSGYLLPALFLRDRGFDLDKDVRVSFLGSHPAAVQAVRDGTVDVAAVSSDLLIGNAGLAGPLVVLAKAGRMPYDIVVARPGLDPAAVSRMRTALLRLSIHDERGRTALRTFSSVDGFMPVPAGHFDEVIALAARAAEQAVPLAPAGGAPPPAAPPDAGAPTP